MSVWKREQIVVISLIISFLSEIRFLSSCFFVHEYQNSSFAYKCSIINSYMLPLGKVYVQYTQYY